MFFTVALFNPLDTLKVRWQTHPQSTVANTAKEGRVTLASFAAEILKQEGWWRGLQRPGMFSNALSMGMASTTRMGLYPLFRDAAVALSPPGSENKKAEKQFYHMFLAGLAPGAIGYWLCSPLYQVKTQLQTENGLLDKKTGRFLTGIRAGHKPEYTGMVQGLGKLWREGGAAGLFRGSSAMVGRMDLLQGRNLDWVYTVRGTLLYIGSGQGSSSS